MHNTTPNTASIVQRKLSDKSLSRAEMRDLLGSVSAAKLQAQHRADLLPALFKLRGTPYSLDDYPQFREMYSHVYAPDAIWLCGRQIGKSMNLSRSEILDCITIPHFQLLYIAPLKPQTLRYSGLYLSEAISTCKRARRLQVKGTSLPGADEADDPDAGPIMKNLTHRSFTNGAGIQLTYAKTSSDRARGIYADRIDFDEIQDQLIDNIPIVTQSLSQSEWGIRRFTGTAKTVDNTIEHMWMRSSQSEWVIKCSHCNHWNIPTMEGKDLDMIKFAGPHCIKCGRLMNVRNGGFVAKYPDRVKTFVGYHIPQIVVPSITENKVKWSRLVNKVVNSPLPVIMQEILGISCNVGARILSPEDIDKQCILPSVADLQNRLGDYVLRVGGVDWGIAEQTSFTVHTVIGIRSDGKIHVLWAKRFSGFDPEEVLRDITKTHFYYRCDLICCDFGMGFDKNVMLQKRFGLPVVQIQYSMQNQMMNFRPILDYPRWMIDKTSALDMLFWAIKYGGIQFPPKAEIGEYTVDLLSPYEEASDAGGISRRRYLRNPDRPDDFCHALCFAMIGGMKRLGHSAMSAIPEDALNADGMDFSSAPIADSLNMQDILSNDA